MIHQLWTGEEVIWICAHKENKPDDTCEFYHDCDMKIKCDGFFNHRESGINILWTHIAPPECPFREQAEKQMREADDENDRD